MVEISFNQTNFFNHLFTSNYIASFSIPTLVNSSEARQGSPEVQYNLEQN